MTKFWNRTRSAPVALAGASEFGAARVPSSRLENHRVGRPAVLVTGLPRCGKTTLIKSKVFPREVAVAASFADVMQEIIDRDYPQNSSDTIWPADRTKVREEAADKIAKLEPREKLLVIDGQLIVHTPNGWKTGVPAQVWSLLALRAIIVVHVPTGELEQRINPSKVGASGRELMSIAQGLVHATAGSYAGLGASPSPDQPSDLECALYVLENAAGEQANAEKELAEYVREMAARYGTLRVNGAEV